MSNVFYGTTPHDQLQHKVCGQCWGPNGNLIDLPSDFLFPDHANFGDFTLLFCRGQLRIVHWNASTQLLFYPSNLLFCHVFVAVAVVVCFLKVPILMLGLKKGQINRWSRHSSAVLVSPHYLYYHPTPLNQKKDLYFSLTPPPDPIFFLSNSHWELVRHNSRFSFSLTSKIQPKDPWSSVLGHPTYNAYEEGDRE